MTTPTARLKTLDGPWLHFVLATPDGLAAELDELRSTCGYKVWFLDGSKMTTLAGLFAEFSQRLNFPEYFGHNSAAFDECLADLSWHDTAGFCMVVTAAEQLLIDQQDDLEWLLDLLTGICKEWSVAVAVGEPWDRPALPFHVVFSAEESFAGEVPPEVRALTSDL